MSPRRLFARWLWPAAVVLPLWLLIGWGVSGAGGWAFLWVLFIAVPSVTVTQVVATLLNRARPSVRRTGEASWLDVAGFGVWHALTIAVGLFAESWFGFALAAAILAAGGLLWLQARQLWQEASPSRLLRDATADADRTLRGDPFAGSSWTSRAEPRADRVIVIREGETGPR